MDTKAVLKLWKELNSCIADEISKNEEFSRKVGMIFENGKVPEKLKKSNRRAPAKVDPFAIIEQSVDALKNALGALGIEELKDVIAENGNGYRQARNEVERS